MGPVEHGGTYSDPVTGLARQFDYRFQIETGNRAVVGAVECKNIGGKPLVICGAARTNEEAYHDLIAIHPPGPINDGRGYIDGWSSKTRRFHAPDSVYTAGSFVGKSSFRVATKFRGQKNEGLSLESDADVYERWAQALSSCHDLCQNAGNGYNLRKRHLCYYFVVPLMVVSDECLWVLEYNQSGEPASEPRQVDYCEYFVGRRMAVLEGHALHSHHMKISHLHIVTLSGLKTLCGEMGTDGAPKRVDGIQDVSFWGRYFPNIEPVILRQK